MSALTEAFEEIYGQDFVNFAVLKAQYIGVKEGPEGEKLCPKCERKISIVGKPYCAWCG